MVLQYTVHTVYSEWSTVFNLLEQTQKLQKKQFEGTISEFANLYILVCLHRKYSHKKSIKLLPA